jgi:hypothetical protein
MADCCNEVKAELSALRAEIAALNNKFILKSERPQIIQASAAAAEELILPGLIVLVSTLIYNALLPVKGSLAALSIAVKGAAAAAAAAAGTAATALTKVAALTIAIAGFVTSIAALNTLGGRIDAVENGLASLGNDVSGLLGRVLGIKNTAERAEGKADKAQVGVNDLFRITGAINQDLINTKSLANTALNKANIADIKAQNAQATAETAVKIGNTALNTAKEALAQTAQLKQRIENVNDRLSVTNYEVDVLQGNVIDLQEKVDMASRSADRAYQEAISAQSKAREAISKAENALSAAQSAISRAESAFSTAQSANTKAESAITIARNALTEISRLNTRIAELEAGIAQARIEANAALQLGGVAISTAANTAQGLSNVQGRVGIIGGTAINADTKATSALGEISSIRNGVVSNPSIPTAVAQPLNQVRQKQQETDRAINQIQQRLGNPTATGNNIPVTKAEFEQIKQRLGEGEKVNAEGNRKLDDILGRLPFIPAATAAAVAARVPDVPAIKQAVGQATCESARGGCIAGALNDQSNSLKQDFGQKLRDLEQGLNAGANAAQLTLLNTINTKLGAQVIGGLSGSLNKFYEWAHIGQVLNILTFAATVHNAAMLSNDVAQTLLASINNVLTLILPKDKDNNPINVGAIIGGSIQSAITGIIGAENYTALNETWAKANRIYQASTNVLNSFLSLSQVILQASELIAAYTGRIGNALKKGGVVLENAYGWMNPQPKFNRVTSILENLQNGANTIQMVTQAPLDIVNATTELTTASTEFVKAVKEDDKPANVATAQPEPDKLKTDENQALVISQPVAFDVSDLFDGED